MKLHFSTFALVRHSGPAYFCVPFSAVVVFCPLPFPLKTNFMKYLLLLLLPLLFLASGCGGDDVCDEELPSLDDFIAENNADDDVQEGMEGLRYIIMNEGTGVDRPSPTATVTVNYQGVLTDGTPFDGTPENGLSPIRFRLDNLIRGWQLGIPLVGRGGRLRLFVPSQLGYGAAGVGSICPNSDLIFDIDLVNFVE